VNDTCQTNNDCISVLCNKYCLGFPQGATCQYLGQCSPGLFCQGLTGTTNGTCVSLLTSGTCTSSAQCAYGYACEKNSPTDNLQCFAVNSRQAGQYCGTTSSLCTGSNRCANGYCAKSSGDTCNGAGGGQCSATQVCACGGMGNFGGDGNCVGTCQYSSGDALNKCLLTNCQTGYISPGTYSGSCAQRLCTAQLTAWFACNSASTVMGSFSLLFISVFFLIFHKF